MLQQKFRGRWVTLLTHTARRGRLILEWVTVFVPVYSVWMYQANSAWSSWVSAISKTEGVTNRHST